IYKGDSSSSPKSLCACNEKLYFSALRPDGDSSLLVFDPATNETRMLPSQYSGGRFTVSGMTELDGEMTFSANDPADYKGKLWAMDASEAMRLVHDFPDSIGSPFGGGPKDFAVLHDTLFFRAMTDVCSDKVFFGCTGHSNDNELWAYDGVNPPFLAVNIDPDGSSYPLALGTFNGTLFIQTGDDRSKGTIVAYNGTSV
ncbi:unnamed protein product, partial [Symbiodinium sp. KB8]